MLTRTLLIAIFVFCLTASCFAYIYLDFEDAVVQPNDPNFGFLDWNLIAPGWGHSPGSDTGSIYYGQHHYGCSQWFMLLGPSGTGHGTPLSGNYSLALESGGQSSYDPLPWQNAYISLTGYIPAGGSTIRLRATGNFGVFVNDVQIPMSYSSPYYTGNLSNFGGQNATVKIQNMTPYSEEWYYDTPIVVDDIRVSMVVPEPSTLLTLASGLLGSAFIFRRRR